MELFGISLPALLSQLLLGLVNGSFYAILSLGLAVIFGLLNVINFAHGALYMMGAMFAWMGLTYFGLNYWVMLVVAPLLVGIFGVIIERLLLRHLQARSFVRPAAYVWLDPADRRIFPFVLRRVGAAVQRSGAADRRAQSGLHDLAQLSSVGRARFTDRLLRHVVCDRAHQARRVTACWYRKTRS